MDSLSEAAGLTSAEAAARLAQHGRNELLDVSKPKWRVHNESTKEQLIVGRDAIN
jgi:hypothetical protein